jgi:CPA1 family monovalent cation:H+ antiporter
MSTLATVSLIVTAAALFGWFSSRVLRLPITIGTMLLTVVSSMALMLLSQRFPGIHDGAVVLVERIKFEDLILHGVLGLLLFAGAFLLDLEYLAKEKLAVGLLSVVGTLLSTGGIAAVMHMVLPLLGTPAPWLECLFFGALISPTDPIAVLEMLHRVGVAKNIQAQLAGESLFNDGVSAVLFLAVLDASRGAAPSVSHVSWMLLVKSCGGLALGVGLAWVASELMRRVDSFQIEVLMTLALALGGYALGEVMRVSSPLEAVAAGLALRHFNLQHHHEDISHKSLDQFWRTVDEVQNAILFVLLGLEVLVIPFSRATFLSGGLAIVSVTLIRAAVVAAVLVLVRWLQRGHESSFMTLTWGGLRGGLSIALALSVPESQGRGWILATTYIVVVFSVVVQGGTLDLFLQRVGDRRKRLVKVGTRQGR